MLAHLTLKLPGAPPGIAQRHQPFRGATPFGNRAQHIHRGGKRAKRGHLDRTTAPPIGAVKHKAARGFNRAAIEHRPIRRDARIDADIGKQAVQRDTLADATEADAERAMFIVHTHRDHRAVETRIAHAGHGEEKAAGEIVCFSHAATALLRRSSAASISRFSTSRKRLSASIFSPSRSVT